jgi:hypothetical protein
MKLRNWLWILIGIAAWCGANAVAEEQEAGNGARSVVRTTAPFTVSAEPGVRVKSADVCSAAEIDPNSASPTWDTPAATVPCGALETDNLLIMQPVGAGVHQQMMVTTAKYGLTPHLEIRWGLPGRMMQSGAGTSRLVGTTDQWLGACYRFHDQGGWLPDLALDYALKIPTANPAKGFGSGYTDHLLMFIASRDAGRTHVDFNVVGTIAGATGGSDGAAQLGLALTRPIGSRFLGTIEAYGGPQPGTSDRYGAGLVGGAWSVHPWLSLNAAYAHAYTAGAPRQQLILGFIYTIRPGFGLPGGSRIRSLLGR